MPPTLRAFHFSVSASLVYIWSAVLTPWPLGVYLTDLTFIEDGIPSVIKKTNMINFAKRAKTAEVISDIRQYQNVAYSLQPVPELQDYILSNMQAAKDVHEMYEKSLQIEPREREDEKIVRYVETRKAQLGLTSKGVLSWG
jgi:son of sevenless-like protein